MLKHFFRSLPALIAMTIAGALTWAPAAAWSAQVQSRETLSLAIPGRSSLDATVVKLARSRQAAQLPAIIVLGGFQNAAGVVDLVTGLFPEAQDGIVAGFDYPFTPRREFRFPSSLALAPEVKELARATPLAIRELSRVLRARKDVDPRRLVVVGASFGAPFAVQAAAEDAAITHVALVHGFGEVPQVAAAQLTQAWARSQEAGLLKAIAGPFVSAGARTFSELAWFYLGAPSPEESARKLSAHQKVFVVSAAQDRFIPRSASESLWSALEESPAVTKRLIMPGDHLQPGSEELIRTIMASLSEWLADAR